MASYIGIDIYRRGWVGQMDGLQAWAVEQDKTEGQEWVVPSTNNAVAIPPFPSIRRGAASGHQRRYLRALNPS